MKIHFLPPLPPAPPAPPPKPLKTAFEVELATQELIRTARQQRAQRLNRRKFQADGRHAGPGDADGVAKPVPGDDEIDFTV